MKKNIALLIAKISIRQDFQEEMSFDELYDCIINHVKAHRSTDSVEGVSNEGIVELIKGLLNEMENISEK